MRTKTDEILAVDAKAAEHGLNYVKLDGAGLVMSTLDVVANAGERHRGQRPANFLHIGIGASAEVMEASLRLMLSDPQVKAVYINVFGGITACDVVAKGIVGALAVLGKDARTPLVVRLDGNNVDEGHRILNDFAHRSCGRARPHALRSQATMSIFLDKDCTIIVQGITGKDGSEHARRVLAAEANVSVIFVPPAFAKAALLEAIDAGIELAVVIGPNCPGIITPANVTGSGPVGLISKSGTLTYQMMHELSRRIPRRRRSCSSARSAAMRRKVRRRR